MALGNLLSKMTSPEAARLGPMRTPGAKAPKAPKTFNYAPPPTKTPKQPKTLGQQAAADPFSAFTQRDPYQTSQIPLLAQQGYNQDAALAKTNAAAGYLTPDQIDARAGNQVAQEQALSSSLSQRLAGLMGVSVASGNALAGGLQGDQQSTEDAAARAAITSGGVAAPSTLPSAVAALTASQNAAEGNRYGGLSAAALQTGNVYGQKALDNATTLKQTNAVDQAHTLATLLASIASPSARAATMTSANTGVESANKATELSIWTGLENRRLQAAAEHDKVAEAAATRLENNYEAGLSSADRRYVADEAAAQSGANAGLSARTSRANNADTNAEGRYAADLQAKTRKDVARISARAKAAGKAAGLTPTQAATWATKIVQIRNQNSGEKVTQPTGYKISYLPPIPTGPGGVALPNAKQPPVAHFDISAADYAAGTWKSRIPTGGKFQGSAPTGSKSATVNAASEWTRYKEALSYTQSLHPAWTRTQAVHALGQAGWPAPKSGGK